MDNDSNFSSPEINKNLDGASFTPTAALPDGTYYWRVAMRRSSTVIGHWTPTMAFIKRSWAPQALAPRADEVVNAQPTFTWTTVLTPTVTPRLAAPRYRLQLSVDPNFSSPRTYDTDSTSYTLAQGESLADGTWYWRVAVLDAYNRTGTYSPVQRFYKEYLQPTLLSPAQGSTTSRSPVFEWAPLPGAAYYRIQIANNELFNGATTATTDATRYTPAAQLSKGVVFLARADDRRGWQDRAVRSRPGTRRQRGAPAADHALDGMRLP